MVVDDTETWSAVPGHEGWYEVSTLGRVRSWRNSGPHPRRLHPHVLQPGASSAGGYLQVKLVQDGGRVKNAFVHCLVAEAFLGRRPEGAECAHRNGDPADNRLANLMWASPVTNMAHRDAHGTTARGRKNGKARMTEAGVRELRVLAASGEPYEHLAARFGISAPNVSHIVSRRTWAHV